MLWNAWHLSRGIIGTYIVEGWHLYCGILNPRITSCKSQDKVFFLLSKLHYFLSGWYESSAYGSEVRRIKCFLPAFWDFTLPDKTHLLMVISDILSNTAASFSVSIALALISLIWSSVINVFGFCLISVFKLVWLIFSFLFFLLYNRFAQSSEQHCVTVVFAIKSFYRIRRLLRFEYYDSWLCVCALKHKNPVKNFRHNKNPW